MRLTAGHLGHKWTLFKEEIFRLNIVLVLLPHPGFYANTPVAKDHLSVTLLRSVLPFLSHSDAFSLYLSFGVLF